MTFKLDNMCSIVRNINTTMDFYTNIVGGQVVENKILNDVKYAYVQILDHFMLFVEPLNHTELTQYGLKNLAFATDDLDKAYKYLLNEGYEFHILPQENPLGNGRNAFFKDPNGVIIEIIQREKEIHRKPINSPIVCSFDHYAVKSYDLNLAHKLYHKHLSLENLAHFIVGDNIREIMYLGSDTATLEIVQSDAYDKDDNPHSHICFRVEDIHKTCEKLKELNIKTSPISTPGINFGLTSSFYDPEGIRIELVSRCDLRNLEENGYTLKTVPAMRPF